MDPVEEQAQELEVLESIYPDEFHKFSATHFQIKVKLDTASVRRHTLILDIKYPTQYPEVVPEISVTTNDDASDEEEEELSDEENESDEDDEDTREVKRALHMSEQVEFTSLDLEQLEKRLYAEAETQIGIPMAFALASQLKEEAESRFGQILDAMNAAHERRSREREMKEQEKFNGTKVTKELFLEWREKFRKEMKLEEWEEAKRLAMHNGKLSGRQIFERGLAGAEDDDLVEGLKKIEV